MPAPTLLFCCLSPNTTISSKWSLRVFWKAGLSTSQPQVLFSWFELLEIFQTSKNPGRNSAIMELVCVRAFTFVQFDSELKALKFNFDNVVIECSPTFALRHIFPPLFHWILVSPPSAPRTCFFSLKMNCHTRESCPGLYQFWTFYYVTYYQ